VGAGVIEVFALEPNGGAYILGETRRITQRRRPPDVRREHLIQLGDERRIDARRVIRALEIVDRRDESFRNIPTAEHTESVLLCGCHMGIEACETGVAKGAHSFVIFDARRALHAGRHIDDIRTEHRDRLRDIFRRSPPARMIGVLPRILRSSCAIPVHASVTPVPPSAPGTSASRSNPSPRRSSSPVASGSWFPATRITGQIAALTAPRRSSRPASIGGSMELDHIETHCVNNASHFSRALVGEDANAAHVLRERRATPRRRALE
jgi:hypothetical protein